jgi:hypothetical protein
MPCGLQVSNGPSVSDRMPAIANGTRSRSVLRRFPIWSGVNSNVTASLPFSHAHLKNCQPATIDINYLAVDIARCR